MTGVVGVARQVKVAVQMGREFSHMNRIRYGALVMLAALAAPYAHAQDALATIKAAEYALGMIRGPQRIDAINTLEVWGTGTSSNGTISNGGPAVKITYHASYSYRTPAMRVDITRGGPDAQRQIQVVNGQYAWNESVPGGGFIPGSTATPAPAALNERLLIARLSRLDLLICPEGRVRASGPIPRMTLQGDPGASQIGVVLLQLGFGRFQFGLNPVQFALIGARVDLRANLAGFDLRVDGAIDLRDDA